jgi:choline dehydrogenase-like flavoprotein
VAFAAALPGWFGDHFQRMAAYRHFACAGVLIGTDHNGRVKRTGQLRELFGPVDYRMTRADLERMRRGMAVLARVYFAAGAERVLPATFTDVVLERTDFGSAPPEAIERRLARAVRRPEDLTLSSAHPQGGNPMSDDRGRGVVDSRFRVHDTDNLYVCDASVFPTTIAINPQLTIMAMADYFTALAEL